MDQRAKQVLDNQGLQGGETVFIVDPLKKRFGQSGQLHTCKGEVASVQFKDDPENVYLYGIGSLSRKPRDPT